MLAYRKVFAVTTVCFLVIIPTAAAVEQGHGEHEQSTHYHLNMVEFFLGGTYEDGEHGSEEGFTVGFAYERRLNELLGIGAFYEYAAGDLDNWSIGAPLFIHPYEGWRFVVAPGMEHRNGGHEFLFRTGVGYEFELSERWVMIPEFNVDFVDGEQAYVFGIVFGFGF
jgi:hypothetical protein